MNELKKINKPSSKSSKKLKLAAMVAGSLTALIALPVIRLQVIKYAETREQEKRKNELDADKYLDECLTMAAEGNFLIARNSLHRLNPHKMKSTLKAKWFTTMTKIYQMQANVNTDNQQFYIMQALTYAQRGLMAGANQNVRDNLQQMKAQLFILNEQWEAAAAIYEDLQTRTKTPRDRWKYRLTIADCYRNLDEYDKAIRLLDSVIDETDEESTWANALRRKADILHRKTQIKHNISNVPFDPSNNLLTYTVNTSLENMGILLEAEQYYLELVKGISVNVHPDKMKALEKLLEIYVNRGQTLESYRYANLLKKASGDRPYSAAVYMHMARLEVSRNSLDKAERYLTRLINSHPESPQTEPALIDYYELLKKKKEWAKAFRLAHKITQSAVGMNTKIHVIQDLVLGGILIENNDLSAKDTQNKVTAMFDSIETDDNEQQGILEFARASNEFTLGHYYNSDVHFSKYLRTPGFNVYKEQAHYYYLLSAVKANLPPVVQALRAKLYLNNTYNSKHSQEAMLYLMSAYYDMDLWDQSIDAAMKVFVNEIVRMGEEHENYKASDEWLKAVARIGQSYEKLGEDTKAQSVFTTWSKEFKKSPYAASIYADWAQIASDRGQHREALRRLNIIMPFIKKPNDFLLLVSMSCIQKLKVNDANAWKEAKALVQQLPKKKKKLDPQKVERLLKDIHIAMLENAIEHHPEKAEETFNLTLKKYNGSPWPYNLIIKWLHKNRDSKNFKDINVFLQKAVSGPLSALNEGELRRAIKDQADLLVAMENENIY
jgi:tetratricopeptide (TPR) repeat protein